MIPRMSSGFLKKPPCSTGAEAIDALWAARGIAKLGSSLWLEPRVDSIRFDLDWIGPIWIGLGPIWIRSGLGPIWIGFGPDLKLAPCGPDDADGDVRGGGDEDGDDDDDDYGEDKYYDGDGAIIGLDLAEIGSDQNYKMEIRVAQSSVGSGFARV